MFHSLHSPDWFENALGTISKLYRFVPVEDIRGYYYDGKNFNNCCHVCFDDGDKTFYEIAYPILKRMGVPATLFVSPEIISAGSNYWFQELGYIMKRMDRGTLIDAICRIRNWDPGTVRQYAPYSIFKSMTISDIWSLIGGIKDLHKITIEQNFNIGTEQLIELDRSDLITVGAHTMSHPLLANEDEKKAENEITESITELSKMLGKPMEYFAYPNGKRELDFGPREQSILRDNGIKLAFTTDAGYFGKSTDPLCVPRGGYGGLERENKTWILGKLLLVPIWDRIGRVLIRRHEAVERKKILASGILKT
jgi:peptidoglycan/xylan/chitin deacetylase (PgdA/CDA1 family)